MNSLARRLQDLCNLHIRLHIAEGKAVTFVDGICQGVQNGAIILAPSSLGDRTDVLLERIYAVTQLPGSIDEWEETVPRVCVPTQENVRSWARRN